MTDSNTYSTSTVSTTGNGVMIGGSSGSLSSSTGVTTFVQASNPDDSDGMSAFLSGDATAVGNDTLTAGNLSGTLIEGPSLTSAELSASMLAAGESPTGGAIASASTSAGVSDGSEVVVGGTVQSATSVQGPTGSSAVATSTTILAALDINAPTDGSASAAETGLTSESDPYAGAGYAAVNLDIDGNIALIEFDAVVVGDNTFAGVDAFVLAVEDQLSVSGAIIELAVD